MINKADALADRIENKAGSHDPLVIVPQPSIEELRRSGAASIDLRLGSWFISPKLSHVTSIDLTEPRENELHKTTQMTYVPFGKNYTLHPRHFVLGATLEWLRIPKMLAGYVTARSSWGRRGLVIATAVGVHPGFSGCLTLELTNLGEVPIAIQPGMSLCQLFLHQVSTNSESVDDSVFVGHRRPTFGSLKLDEIARKLGAPI